MRVAEPFAGGEIRFRRSLQVCAFGLAVLFAALFLAWPSLDIIAGEVLRICSGAGGEAAWCARNPVVELVRDGFIYLTVVVSLGIIAVLVHEWRRENSQNRHVRQAQIVFAITSIVAAPVIANVVFKDNWGRARPREIVELGGKKQFTPPLIISDQCARNCSFVSGEASSAFAPLIVGAFLFPHVRLVLIGGGIAMGLLAGLIRMSQGGHFLSDVLFAGVMVVMVVGLVHALLLGLRRKRLS